MTLPPACEPDAAPAEDSTNLRWQVIWRVMVSALYHQKRERFLDGADRAAQALSVLAGAAAFGKLMETKDGFSIPAAVVALVGTAALCYGPSAKARKHADLARRFKLLHAEILRCDEPFTAKCKTRFEAEVLLLESEEPAALGALVRQCENELSTAIGKPEDVVPLTLIQRIFVNVLDFDMSEKPTSSLNLFQRTVARLCGIPESKSASQDNAAPRTAEQDAGV